MIIFEVAWSMRRYFIRYFVLFALSDNLLAQNQLYKSFTTMLASVYNTFRSEFDKYMVVSSAKDKILHLHDLLMSLT